jgi:hypothetical protein
VTVLLSPRFRYSDLKEAALLGPVTLWVLKVVAGAVRRVHYQAAEREQGDSLSVGKEAEVANADEVAREQVQEETAQEFVESQAHDSFLVVAGGVSVCCSPFSKISRTSLPRRAICSGSRNSIRPSCSTFDLPRSSLASSDLLRSMCNSVGRTTLEPRSF